VEQKTGQGAEGGAPFNPAVDCPHPCWEPTWRNNAARRRTYWLQCLACGYLGRNQISAQAAREGREPAPVDEPLLARFNEQTRLFYAQRDAFYAEQQATWRDRYNAYLASPEWQAKRALVLKRDGFICQECFSRPASQVHHLSYKHLGDEPLDDLLSLCRICHQRIHREKDEAWAGLLQPDTVQLRELV
jgi:hypothetical protein